MRFANRILRGAAAAFTLSLTMTLTMALPAHAQSESVNWAFCSLTKCDDGSQSTANVIKDEQGNIYGTTVYGGVNGHGTIFKLDPGGTLTVLYSFCSVGGRHCADGDTPCSGLIRDSAGNLYGTTELGGTHEYGTVFQLSATGVF